MRILVIEDNPSQLKLAHDVLSYAGFTVQNADAASQALATIKASKPEVLLVDLGLPGMDGLTLVRRLKQDPDTRDIPVVAITAYPELYTKQQALEAGCDAYLVKPVDTRTLPQNILDIAGRPSGGLGES
jgi:CheY-like chemotaxis protein